MAAPYGSLGDDKGALFDGIPAGAFVTLGKHRRMNVLAILVNLFVPWLYFCFECWAFSYWPHYSYPRLICWPSVVLGLGAVCFSGYSAYRCKENHTDPKWYSFFTCAMLIAILFGVGLGDANFRSYMEAVYDQDNMNSYPNVNPAEAKGQQLMDAGRIYFSEGSGLDSGKSMSFKNRETYCVAPIVSGDEQLASYDYWAVGIDCCNDQDSKFRCGEYLNNHAHAGLRQMHDEERPFFRLAVQQAEAAYNIRAEHPMFFYWVQDPLAKISMWKRAAFRSLCASCVCHFVFNFFCVAVAVIFFSKMSSSGV